MVTPPPPARDTLEFSTALLLGMVAGAAVAVILKPADRPTTSPLPWTKRSRSDRAARSFRVAGKVLRRRAWPG